MTDNISELARLLHETSPDCRLQRVSEHDRAVHASADLHWATALDIYGVGLHAEARDIRVAALRVIAARKAYRDAVNGLGHPNEPHDKILYQPGRILASGDVEVFDTVGDCSACGGAQYGTEDVLERAFDSLHAALGVPLPEYRAEPEWVAADRFELADTWVPHIIEEGSRFHVISWSNLGRKCSEPRCEINKPSVPPVLFHVDCGTAMDGLWCPKCSLYPDMQSTGLR